LLFHLILKEEVDMIKDANSDNRLPHHWAAFVAIGGHANF
jgi:hypothetical protein